MATKESSGKKAPPKGGAPIITVTITPEIPAITKAEYKKELAALQKALKAKPALSDADMQKAVNLLARYRKTNNMVDMITVLTKKQKAGGLEEKDKDKLKFLAHECKALLDESGRSLSEAKLPSPFPFDLADAIKACHQRTIDELSKEKSRRLTEMVAIKTDGSTSKLDPTYSTKLFSAYAYIYFINEERQADMLKGAPKPAQSHTDYPDVLGHIVKVVTQKHLAYKRTYRDYTDDWKDDMRALAELFCIKYSHNYDPTVKTKSADPYYYLAQLCDNGFKQKINELKKTASRTVMVSNEQLDQQTHSEDDPTII